MIKILFLIFFLIQVTHANAAEIGADWWKNCPGPGCPAKVPAESYERSEKTIKPEKSNSYKKTNKDYKEMDRYELRNARERHEKAIDKIDKEERKR